jgi:hypothetical protein
MRMNSLHGETDRAAVEALVALALAEAKEALRPSAGGLADTAAAARETVPTVKPRPR